MSHNWNIDPAPARHALSSLPRLKLLAFGARCARRLQALHAPRGSLYGLAQTVDRYIESVEHCAEGGLSVTEPGADFFSSLRTAQEKYHRAPPSSLGRLLAESEIRFLTFIRTLTLSDSTESAQHDITTACEDACLQYVLQRWLQHTTIDITVDLEKDEPRPLGVPPACATASRIASHALWRDYDLLRENSIPTSWNDVTPVPRTFFALRSEFDIPIEGEHSTFLEVRQLIQIEFADYFLRHPHRLASLEAREFEETVASILKGLGFSVELTARTHDGGRDIIATTLQPVGIQLLIECKRYRTNRNVGVNVVRALHGVVEDHGASKGILVTTGRISGPARKHLARNRWRLEGRDLAGLVEWLQQYQRTQITRISRLLRNDPGPPQRYQGDDIGS